MALGAVVASRLSEIKDWNVLLLEAGGDETEISDVPLLAGYLQLSQLDWQYKTEPQDGVCLGNFYSTSIISSFFLNSASISSSLSLSLFLFCILLNISSDGE